MSISLQDIKNAFNKYISIYEGLLVVEKNYDDNYLLSRIGEIALNNKRYTKDLYKIIVDHLKKDDYKCKVKLFNIIDYLFKSVGGEYIDKLNKYLFEPFKECFTKCEKEERILLFKIFYTWKYLLPQNVLDKIREDNQIDDFKQMFIKDNPGKIEKYDQYNEKMKLKKIEQMNNNNNNHNIINNFNNSKNNNNINLSKNKNNNNNNNNQNNNKKIILEKKFKEDIYQNQNNNNIKDNNSSIIPKNLMINTTKSKTKKSSNKTMLTKKRKSSHEKSTDGNISTNKNKVIHNPANNKINININHQQNDNPNKINNSNINNIISNNELISNLSNISNIPLNILFQSGGLNLTNLQNIQNMQNLQNIQSLQNLQNINNIQNNITNLLSQNQQPQQLIKNIILNMMANNNPFNSSNQNQVKPSIIEYNLFNFLQNTNTKLDTNLRFFSSLAKYYNEVLLKRDMIDLKCKYEDIYNNDEYKDIRQKVDTKLFKDIKKNICAICGFRTLFYNKLIEHLDIHFNINYLKMEGKNLFRKKGHNRNNWITGENSNNKNIKNKVGYTLGNLLYYKNMMNNNLIKISNEQEEDNEEFMYPIDEENKEICYYCGDEFKKVFSTKYHYWFYYKVVQIREEKKKILVHQSCYDEIIKKV